MLRIMLETLRVKNFAIVEDATVNLIGGLNVITGETGAGKSILIGALNLLLGERSDRTMIRAGEDKCSVDATFAMESSADVHTLLDDLGIDPCEDGNLVIRRTISTSGAGKNHVNGCATTVQSLKAIGNLLVDMHGPHDHQSLLDPGFQLDILDAFGRMQKPLSSYRAAYDATLALQRQLQELDCDDQQVAQQIDMLSFQVKEIEEADLAEMDEDALDREHAMVANAQRIIELSNGIDSALTSDDACALNAVTIALRLLSELTGIVDTAEDWNKEADAIGTQIRELSRCISEFAHGIDAEPGRLQWLDDRKALLHKLKRKYGASVAEILASLESANERLHDLQTRGQRIGEIEAELASKRKDLVAEGKKLGRGRAKAATELEKAVTAELRALGFSHSSFSVNLAACDPGPAGSDSIEFGFAPNPGEPSRALRTIASSGEISRVMLAIKTVLAAHDRIPVLVFDEIDANVGGEMANAVGAKLQTVAASRQVVCITHLPQVAVHGQAHLVVTKAVKNERTYTRIEPVADKSRTEEIARMLGGRDLTSVALKHAEEMLQANE